MRNGVILAVIAESALISGLHLDSIPLWRQLLFVILAVAAYLHGRHLPVRRGWLLLTVLAMPGVVYAVPDFATGAGALTALGLFVVLPWLAGRFQRQQADLLEAVGSGSPGSGGSGSSSPSASPFASAPVSPRTCTTRSATNWR